MIGPPGFPNLGRRIFARSRTPEQEHAWKWATGLYVAGMLAHFGHYMAFDLPADHIDPSFGAALHGAPTSIFWPLDAIYTLIDQS